MRVCTEIYKSYGKIYVNSTRRGLCGDKEADEDVAGEEDSQNPLH
jgi:hypothetical protein